jgi:hypothetical protein
MDNVIEHIAHFADIDTRRAMGFKPRKLNVNFELPQWERRWTAAWGGQIIWRLGDSFVGRELQIGEVYRCGKTSGTKYYFRYT